ncbi:UNVERIFIED_CONTAM: Zinc finger protein ZAT10 [Sesamum calycinum]|uniref:Zinc finger protein ZAT10 n=1 Tax=Sesamum calycinum TaxID=2727403 RepID=A0AAW2QN21_9LAMI
MALEALNSPTAPPPSFKFDAATYFEPWTKGKRTKRPRSLDRLHDDAHSEEEYLALCLVMLARGGAPPFTLSHRSPNHGFRCRRRRLISLSWCISVPFVTRRLDPTKLWEATRPATASSAPVMTTPHQHPPPPSPHPPSLLVAAVAVGGPTSVLSATNASPRGRPWGATSDAITKAARRAAKAQEQGAAWRPRRRAWAPLLPTGIST